MEEKDWAMINKSSGKSGGYSIPSPSNLLTDDLTNNDSPRKKWRMKCDNKRAARLAVYAARAQMD
jgi:hypothetical protein